jgi:signal transduction histidine kinase
MTRTIAETFRLSSQNLIAYARVLVALVALLFATTDPNMHWLGLEYEFDDIAVVAYVSFALILTVMSVSSWWWTERSFLPVIMIDIYAFIAIPIFIEPHVVAYAVVSSVMAAFIIVQARVMRGFRAAVTATFTLNYLCALACYVLNFGPMEMSLSNSLRQVFVLLAVSMVTLLLSRWMIMQRSLAGPLTLTPKRGGIDRLQMDHVIDQLRASSCVLCRNDTNAPKTVTVVYGADAGRDMGWSVRADWPHVCAAMLYDSKRNRALIMDDDGRVQATRIPPAVKQFAADTGYPSGVAAPFNGAFTRGWIFFADVRGATREDMLTAQRLSIDLAHNLDVETASRTTRELSILRLRGQMARDLHDGVSQSLAGTRFWLRALKAESSSESENASAIDQISEAIEAEQRNIRALIARLRSDEDLTESQDIWTELEDLAQDLREKWNIKVRLTMPPVVVRIPENWMFEIKQMVREAAANAVRHGSAKTLSVNCEQVDGGIRFLIEDDGSGMAITNAASFPKSLRERVTGLGGMIDVKSKSGQTMVDIMLPVGAEP